MSVSPAAETAPIPSNPSDQSAVGGLLPRRRALGRFAAVGLGGVVAYAVGQQGTAVADDPNDADQTLSNLTDYAAARNNLTVAQMHTPEQYGAVGDGTTDDAAAIQDGIDDLAAGGGGTLWFTARTYLIGSTIVLKEGVTLATGTMHRSLLATTGTTTLQADSGLTGWMFDTVGTTYTLGIGIVGFNIRGPGVGLSTAVGGIRLRWALNARLQWLAINNFSAPCISVDQPSISLAIEDCGVQTDSSGRTLTEPCGSLDLGGSDHYIRSIQCNGGPSNTSGADGKTHVTYPGDFYRTGAHIHCISSWIYDLSGEFGDVGIYLGPTANGNRFIGTRADVNAGHGFYLDEASNNQFVGCFAIGNGLATFDTYDGAYLANGAKYNRWTNFMCLPYGALYTRYGWNDATTGNRQTEQNTVDFPVGQIGWFTRDLHNSAEPARYSMQPAGTGTSSERPPSRYMAGNTWYDTTLGKPTFSDGTAWYDHDGEIVGSLVTPDQATGRNELKWAAADSKGTVNGRYTALTPIAVKEAFDELPKLIVATSTSAAVAGGAFPIQGTTRFAVTAGQSYTIGCRTIAGATPATVAIGVNWFNSGGTYLSTTYAAGTVNNTSTLTTAKGTLTAPASATQGQILVAFARSGMASGESHYVSYAFAVKGTTPEFVQP